MAVSQTQLTQLYLAYFGRPPDFDGLVFYTSNPDYDIWQVAAFFSESPESIALYGPTFNAAQINAIYQNLFNRDAEPAGLLYWSTEVASGRLTAAGAAYAIFLGAQNEDLVAVNNKMAVATAFIAALDTSAEIVGYTGADAAESARQFLATVDWTTTSLEAALAGLDAAVAAATGVGGIIGETIVLTAGMDNVVIATGTTIDTVKGVIDGTATDTFTVGDTIDGNGLTIVELALAGNTTAPFTQLSDIKSVDLINATTATVTFEAAGWTNVGEVNLDRGLAGGAAWFSNLATGVDLNISVAGGIGASYTDGEGAYLWDLKAGDSGSIADGNITLNVASGHTGASVSAYGTADVTLGDINLTVGDSSTLEATFSATAGSIAVGNVSVALGDSSTLDQMYITASGDVTVGNVTWVQGDNNGSNDLSISSTSSGDVTVGDISVSIGDYTTSTEFTLDIYANSGDVTVGNITGAVGDSSTGLNVTVENYVGNVTVGSVGMVAGDDSELYLNVQNNSGTGDVSIGFVAMEVGVSSSLDVSITSTGVSGSNLGTMAIGGLSFVLANDATGEVDIEHYSYGSLTGTSAETIGALTVGDIDITLGSDASLSVSITQAMYGTKTTDTATIGDLTVGDVNATLAIGAYLSVDVEASNTNGGGVGNVAVGDVTVVADDGASFDYSLSVTATGDVGSVTVGDVDVTLGVAGRGYFSLTVTGADIGTVDIGDQNWNVGVDSTANQGWWMGIYADGDIGSVGRGDTDVVLGAEASMTYAALSVTATGDIGSVAKGDSSWVLGEGAYASYDYLDVFASGDIGTVTQGDLDVTVGVDATYTNSNYLSVTASGTVDTVTMGDITAQVNAGGDFYFYVSVSGDDGVGAVTVGDISLTTEGGDSAQVWVEVDSTGGDIGSVTVGDIELVASDTAVASFSLDVNATAGALDSLSIGNVDLSVTVSSTVNVNILATAALLTDADITIDAFTLHGSGAYAFHVGNATYTGDITLNNLVVDVTATATGAYDVSDLLVGVLTTGDLTLGTVDYSGYSYTGGSTGVAIDVSGYLGDIVVIGSDQDDVITDNDETNVLTGNDGADVFSFVAMDANNVGLSLAAADVITDFEHGVDVIELDTTVASTADQYFEGTAATFAAFVTMAKAQMTSAPEDNVVAVQVGSDVYVAVDMNDGDKIDTVIVLTGASITTLNFADFAFI